MMIGERLQYNPTVQVPPWMSADNSPTVEISFPYIPDDYSQPLDAVAALQRYDAADDPDHHVDDYSSDNFRMFEFKVKNCTRGKSHDWTECPYAHPGEKARRRDPRRYHYSGTACPEFRKGNCKRGDACEFSHGVFECWLHPARYRTQPCKDGANCQRRVCFFAHSPEELRVLSPRAPGPVDPFGSPPESVSPPMSPMAESGYLSRSLGSGSVNEMVASLRRLQLNKVKSLPSSWGLKMGGSRFGSPRVAPVARPDYLSLPSTPTRIPTRPFDLWDKGGCEEEPMMERVESGRNLRTKIFEKLSRENPLDRVDSNPTSPGPDVGWVSELVK